MPSPHPLTRFIAACEPGTPAGREKYVARQRPVAERLFQAIQPAARMRALVVGQTGVGKSTELARVADLSVAADSELLALSIPIDEYLDLDLLTWHDLLVFSACHLFKGRTDYDRTDYYSLDAALYPRERRGDRQLETGGPPEPTPTQRFRNNFRLVHNTIESGKAQFWDLAASVIEAAQRERPLAVIWDGLEKMSLSSARRLFSDEAQFLSQLPCRVLITAPLSLTFDESFAQVEEHFSYVERLRAVSTKEKETGQRFCLDLLERRGAGKVCSVGLQLMVIHQSAGVPRQLLQIMSYAAKQALSDGQDQITEESILRACNRLAEKWQYQLGPQDYAALEKADEDREPAERARLLHLGVCVEHDRPEGGLQIDVNPLVTVLMNERATKAKGKTPRG